MKKALLYIGAIVIILLGAALAVPGMLDWNQYKGTLQDAVRTATGHEIRIGGQVALQVVPNPALLAQDVVLLAPGGETSEEVFLSLDQFSVNLAFFPLLTGKAEVRSVTLDGLDVTLERYADGSANWDFLIPDAAGNADDSGGDAEDLQLDSVELTNGHIHYVDAVLGRDDQLQAIDLLLSARTAVGPFEGEGRFERAGHSYDFEARTGRIEVARSFPLSLRLVVNDQTPGLEYQGTMVIDGEASAASGDLKAGGDDLSALLGGLTAIAGADMPSGVNLAQGFEFESPVVLTKARVTARPATLKLGKTGGSMDLLLAPQDGMRAELMLDLNTLKLEDWLVADASGDDGQFSGLPLNAKVDVKLGALEYAGGVARQLSLRLETAEGKGSIGRFSGVLPGGSEVSLRGEIDVSGPAPAFRGPVQLTSDNLRTLLDWLGADTSAIPGGRLAGFAFEGDVNMTGDEIAARDMTGQLDGTLYRGNAARLGGAVSPRWDVDMAVSRFNLDSYVPEDPAAPAGLEAMKSAVAELAAFPGSFKLFADDLSGRGISAKELRLFFRIDDGDLRIHRLRSANILGTQLDMEGSVRSLTQEPQITLAVDVQAQNLGGVTRWMGGESPVDVFKLGQFSYLGNVSGALDAPVLDGSGKIAGGEYRVSGSLGYLAGGAGEYALRVAMDHPNHMELLRRLDVSLEIAGEGEALRVEGDVTGNATRTGFDVQAAVLGGRVAAQGAVDTSAAEPIFDVALTASHSDAIKVMKVFAVPLSPVAGLGPLNFEGRINGSKAKYSIAAQRFEVGPASLTSQISVDETGTRPHAEGQVNFKRLPLHFFVQPGTTGADAAARAGGKRWSREPFDLDMARAWDLVLEVSGEELTYEDWQYRNPGFQLALNNGALLLDRFRGTLFGGQVLGKLDMNFSGTPTGAMSLSMEQARVEQLLDAAAAISPMTGVLSLGVDVTFSGANQLQLVSSLAGDVEIWAQNGAIKGLDVPRLAGRMSRLNRLPDFVGLLGSAFSGGQTPYRNIRTHLTGEKGVFSTRQINADIDGADVRGRMDVRLPQWTITAAGQMQLQPAPPADGAEPLNAAELPPVGVSIDGDIDDPVIFYQTERLKTYMAERFSRALLQNLSGQTSALDVLTGVTGIPTAPATAPTLGPDGQPLPADATQQPAPAAQVPAESTPTANPGAAVMQGIFSLIRQVRPEAAKPEEEKPAEVEPPKPDNNN